MRILYGLYLTLKFLSWKIRKILFNFLQYSKTILMIIFAVIILTFIGIANGSNNDQFKLSVSLHTNYLSNLELLNLKNLREGLYIYTWTNFCQGTINKLKSWALFPNYPMNQSSMIDDLEFEAKPNGDYVQRIFGYLKIPKTGYYRFRTGKIMCIEIWLSTDGSPQTTQLIFNGETSKRVMLEKDKYYYTEIFSIPSEIPETLVIEWTIPGQVDFQTIKSEYLFSSPRLLLNDKTILKEDLPHFQFQETEKQTSEEPKRNLFKLLPAPIAGIQLYNECYYRPSFAKGRQMDSLYQGVLLVSDMHLKFYPEDGTSLGNRYIGNPNVGIEEVDRIFGDFKERLHESRKEIKNIQLRNFEEQFDPRRGSRYLIESEITLESDQIKNYSFSYHIYEPNGSALCHPFSLRIDLDTFVHIAVSVKNQGPWIRYFIENMERIYHTTRDGRFGVLILDFESEDANITNLVENSSLLNKHLITLTGPYSRTSSLNTAINYVQDDNDIIFMCDLHLDIPVDILDVIRKHTFLGVSGYAPAMFRLDCGYSTHFAVGNWEMLTYGMFSMYKADWVNVGGFDQEKYKYQWGGEDWELLDRFLEKGYFVERFRQPNLFHYFHERKDMWQAQNDV